MRICTPYFYNVVLVSSFTLCCSFIFALSITPPKVERPISEGAFHIKDMAGQDHLFTRLPKRIVFTANILPPFVTLAGGVSSIIGATENARRGMRSGLLERVYPESAEITVVGDGLLPSFEQILRLEPDSVFAWTYQTEFLKRDALFDAVGFNIGYPSIPSHTALWRILGALTGQEAKAEALLETYRDKVNDVTKGIPSSSKYRPRALILMSGADKLWIGTGYHYLNDRLELAGAQNAVRGKIGNLFSLEDVLRLDPDVILIDGLNNLRPEDLFGEPVWQMIRAVRAHKVYHVPNFAIFTTPVFDPLLVHWLVDVLYPETSPNDMRAAFRLTYKHVYHYALDEDEIDQVLNVGENSQSFGYARFLANSETH